MATGNIKNILGFDNIDLDVIQGKVLEILSNNTLGIYASAVIEKPAQVKAGSVVYRLPELMKVKSYKRKDNDTQTIKAPTKLVNLDKYRVVKYELETFDLAGISDSQQLQAQIAKGVALAVKGYLDAVFFDFVAKNADSSKVISDPASYSNEDLRKQRMEFTIEATKLITLITANMIGTDKSATLTATNPLTYAHLVEGASLVGSEKGQNQILSGEIEGAKIGGFEYTNHIYLGQNLEQLPIEDTDDNLEDLTQVKGLIWNKQAIAFPVDFVDIKMVISPDTGNPIFIQKFRYGIEKLRTQLITKITSA